MPPRPPSAQGQIGAGGGGVQQLQGAPIGTESMLDFKLSQCFGDCSPAEDVTEADILSAVQFDKTGDYLATGDRGGRVVIFKQNSGGKQKVSASGKIRRTSDFKFFTEFQSHEAEFDYLKSLEIEEKINQIKWCPRACNALLLLSTNDKTIKLWKVWEQQVKHITLRGGNRGVGGMDFDTNSSGTQGSSWGGVAQQQGLDNSTSSIGMNSSGSDSNTSSQQLCLPQMQVHGSTVTAAPRRIFSNAHAYHINSIDPNSDGEHFISADDLRINLWNLEVTDRCFNIVDIKPRNMEELTEVITSAAFHPMHCNIFMYSSSRGSIKIGDMRISASCDRQARTLEEATDPAHKSFFSEIVASISDMKATSCGRYIVSRDYMTVKIWDIAMEAKPVKTINVHEHLRTQLSDLYENDCIFDKFECAVSGDATGVLTGSYNNMCYMYNRMGQLQASLEVCKDPSKRSQKKGRRRSSALGTAPLPGEPIDFDKKVLHMSWHPKDDIIAVAGLNKLYIYTAQRS